VSPGRLNPDCNPALYPAADRYGTIRNHTLIVVALHSGLRAEELCKLKPHYVKLGKKGSDGEKEVRPIAVKAPG
jgi:integrase